MKNYCLAVAMSLVLCAPVHAEKRYTITGLQTTGGYANDIAGINNNGWVTGSFVSGSTTEAFVYNGSQVTTLGTMGGTSSGGSSINDLGWVGGGAFNAGNAAATRPFIYNGSSVLDLATLNASAAGSSVFRLNNSGHALLYGFYVTYNPMPGFVLENYFYNGTSVVPTSSFNPSGITFGLNNNDWMSGTMSVGGVQNPAVYDGTTLKSLGTFGGTYTSFATALNDAGLVTGQASSALGPMAFLYDGTTMQNIGSLLSDPAAFGYTPAKAFSLSSGRGINSSGVIVGESVYDGGGTTLGDVHAFVYEGGAMKDLNDLIDPTSGWELNMAVDINDAGQIVGRGLYNGEARGFILTPVDDSVKGETPGNPLTPESQIDGVTFTFSTVVETVNERVFIDPIVATGYDYSVVGSEFTSVQFTTALVDPNGYELWSADGLTMLGTVQIGDIFTFASPLSAFRLRGIAPQNMLNPGDPNVFVSGFTFSTPGRVTITQSAVTGNFTPGVPEPASWAMMIGGFALLGAQLRQRQQQRTGRVRFA